MLINITIETFLLLAGIFIAAGFAAGWIAGVIRSGKKHNEADEVVSRYW